MAQDVLLLAAGFFESIRQHRHVCEVQWAV
jgi:hypothetical protein